MAEKIKELIREYQEGHISRREFMRQAILVTGSLAAASSLMNTLMPAMASADVVSPNDPEMLTHEVEYPGRTGTLLGYLARPKAPGKYPVVIVVHQNTGLNDHIRDVARRFVKQGYVALAPDYLSRQGGTMKVNPKGDGLSNIRELAPWQNVAEDTESAIEYLRILPDVRGDRIALLGFCWGGGVTFATATKIPTLKAVVVYYGQSPSPIDSVQNIKAPILAHYGEKDANITKGVPETEAAMKKYNKSYEYRIYVGAPHAFNDDTNKERYTTTAAKEAWERTEEFLKKQLKA